MWLDLPDGGGGHESISMDQSRRIEPAHQTQYRNGVFGSGSNRQEENIAGYVLYKRVNNAIEYLLLKKTAVISDWSPPKGHVETGENCCDGAEREVYEETGLTIGDYEVLEQYPIYFEYKTSQQVLKRVHLWAVKFLNTSKPIRLSSEHDEFQWLEYESTLAVVKQPYMEAMMAADLVVRTHESM